MVARLVGVTSLRYRARFGGLLRAYALIGFTPDRDYQYLEINRELRRRLPGVIDEVISGLRNVGGQVRRTDTDLLIVNDEFTASIVIARCLRTPAGAYRWRLRFDAGLAPDLTVVVRMAANHTEALDYYLFPRIDLPMRGAQLSETNALNLDAYRFETLDPLYALASRVPIPLAA